jgi:TonB family protein
MFIKKLHKYFTKTIMLFFLLFTMAFGAQAGPKTFAYIGKNYAITAEAGGPYSFILNFISLSDFVIVIQPNEFIYKAASGRFYIGQVFQQAMKNARGESQKYTASFLLKGRLFAGLTIAGAFREQDQIEELSVRIGAKRFYLQPIEKAAFDQLAAKIGDLDLSNPNTEAALAAAGISETGTVKNTDGTSEWDRDWQGLIGQDGVNPARIVERPDIEPTIEAKKARAYGKVKLSAFINKSGGIQDLKVIKGLSHGLDQRAMEGVRNSWLFLPATRNGEIIETSITIEIDFSDPEKKQ